MKSNVYNKILKVFKPVILLVFVFIFSQLIFSQQSDLTENDIIKQAEKLFDAKDYQGAIPLYAQLVSVHPDEPLYNYRFGVCTLFGDRKDKKKPIRYLSYAALSMTNNQELFYNLGLAFHQNQEFANAMKYYNLYLAKLAPNAPQRAKILEKVNACVNGLTLEHKHLISEVISKSEFQKDNFHRAYKAEDLAGALVIKPDMFKTGKEKKSGEQSFVFISEPRTVLYYSGYDDAMDNKEIFKVIMNDKGDWGKPEKISETINTPFDEDYPVLTNNGTILYFCSKGHNSLGGYDIFKSKLDTATNTFSHPENMGAGINSPFDDILFVVDKENRCAYFASDRDNLNGSINVFKVKLMGSSYENEHFLAHEQNLKNAFPDKKEVQPAPSSEPQNLIAKNENIQQEQKTSVQQTSNPSEKAANMMSDRTKSHKLADSSYLVIAKTKTLVRDLTNKRGRANAISKRKGDEAKEMERRYDECVASLAVIDSEEEFKKTLDKAVKFKEEICQLYQRSNQANMIAWNLGRQIKTKNKELVDLKANAGKIQTTSVSGTYEETLILYTSFKNLVSTADTITDFTEQVMAITNDKASYEIPESEFAFAAKLLDGFNNNTLLAEVKSTKPALQENVPIVVVDNRTNSSGGEIANKAPIVPKTEPLKLVENINYEKTLLTNSEQFDELLEISFNIDYVLEPFPVIAPIHYQLLAFGDIEPDETELQLSFFIDRIDPLKVVKQFDLYQLTYNDELIEEANDVEVDFNVDKIKALDIASPVNIGELAFNTTEPDEIYLEIDLGIDQVEAIQLVDQIDVNQLAFNDITFDQESDLEINYDIDKIEAFDIVSQINTGELAFNTAEPDETYLEIDMAIDQVEAISIVSEISINELAFNTAEPDETYLEIDLGIDQVEALKIVSQINTRELAFNTTEPDETYLEINLEIDQVEAIQLVDQFDVNQLALNEVSTDEEIELDINSDIDNIAALDIVSQINTRELAFNSTEPNETYLEINLGIDQVEAIQLVDQIDVTLLAFNEVLMDENIDLEVNTGIDRIAALDVVSEININELAFNTAEPDETYLEIDLGIDQVEAIRIVSEISTSELAFNTTEPDEIYLEIDLGIDQVEAIQLTDQIDVNLLALNEVLMDENIDLEVNTGIDRIAVLDIVSEININELAFNTTEPDEIYLEINLGIDQVEAINVVNQINANQLASNEISTDEDIYLEINSAIDKVNALNIVSQINTNELAFNEISIDERIEVEKEVPDNSIEPLELVSLVNLGAFASIEPDESVLELNFSNDQATPVEVINPIVFSELAYTDINPNDINLEISFVADQVRLIEIPAKVSPIIYANANDNTGVNEDIEIDFDIDNLNTTNESIQLADATNSNNVIAEETDIEESVSNNFEVERSNFVYYLRESVMKPGTIETSKSDIDLLTLALNNPDELSYEELLYSATLAYSTDEKLAIYNAAFIHIDRDWRAFNNAAITAIHSNNLNQADVYLYQASLISTDNGKIQNNMGILACYKKEFDKAEEHFIAATELGFNAYYNLQVVNSIVDATTEIADNIIINTDIDTHEVIGDIIDYGTSGE